MNTYELTSAQYKTIMNSNNLMKIVEDKPFTFLFDFGRKEYVPTGGCSDWHEAYEVIDIQYYKGALQPLVYPAHFVEVDTGKRPRCYTGMKVRYQSRILVCLEKVLFVKAKNEPKQVSLFEFSISKFKSMNQKRTPKLNRRYKLHQKIKSYFSYSAKEKTIFVPHNLPKEDLFTAEVSELQNVYNYTIQLEIV